MPAPEPSSPSEPSPTTGDVEALVDAFVDEHWSDTVTVRDWWRAMADAGLSSPTLPVEAGGQGWSRDLAAAVAATLSRRQVLGSPSGLGLLLAAPTIAHHGTAEQITRFVPLILDGSEGWCQLFSEPQAGSDLAGLQSRAERDGDEWVVTGQKVWTSTGMTADLGMLIARTDPDAPKHLGITYFAIEMDQPGVEVRPLKEMTGRAVFNEVFLDEARVPHANIIGGLNDGWRVANATLGFERSSGHSGAAFSAALPGSVAGHLDQPASEFTDARSPIVGGAIGRRHVRALMEMAAATGRRGDPLIRQQLAQVETNHRLQRMMAWKGKVSPGSRTPVDGNVGKVFNTSVINAGRDAANAMLGAEGQLFDSEGDAGVFQEVTLFSPAPPIYAGSDQIQRNVIGERGLGLPREPGPSRDTPFSELPKN